MNRYYSNNLNKNQHIVIHIGYILALAYQEFQPLMDTIFVFNEEINIINIRKEKR